MHNDVLRELYKRFDLKAREGVGGRQFKYVPTEDIVNRMNEVFKGNWSTEVRDVEVVEDQVLMNVRVCVTDSDGRTYCHEGYASHPLARYSSGVNKDKIIDIGNSYKSAMSKAIKTACTKWGVALYLEGGSEDSDDKDMPSSTEIPTAAPETSVKPKPIASDIPTSINPAGVPTGPPMGSDIPKNTNEPVFTNENVVPLETTVMDVPFNTQPDSETKEQPIEDAVEKVTLVQKVAIETVMDVNDIKFSDLVAKALKGKTLPPTIDDVTYLDAVTIIQYGNHLRPGQN